MMFWMPQCLSLVHFSDDLRIVSGYDHQSIWYRAGEHNPAASTSSVKFPLALTIFAVVGVRHKSELLMIGETINSDCCFDNLNEFGFIDFLDKGYGVFSWISPPASSDRVQINSC
jgi:hypothetical protein